MEKTCFFRVLLFIAAGIFFCFPAAFGDAADTPTLSDVHKTLLEAAGYQTDTPPTPAEQTDLLNKALRMIQQIPHVYRGQLKAAARDINAALSELSNGDPAHKAREDIFSADTEIKKIM